MKKKTPDSKKTTKKVTVRFSVPGKKSNKIDPIFAQLKAAASPPAKGKKRAFTASARSKCSRLLKDLKDPKKTSVSVAVAKRKFAQICESQASYQQYKADGIAKKAAKPSSPLGAAFKKAQTKKTKK